MQCLCSVPAGPMHPQANTLPDWLYFDQAPDCQRTPSTYRLQDPLKAIVAMCHSGCTEDEKDYLEMSFIPITEN